MNTCPYQGYHYHADVVKWRYLMAKLPPLEREDVDEIKRLDQRMSEYERGDAGHLFKVAEAAFRFARDAKDDPDYRNAFTTISGEEMLRALEEAGYEL